MSPSKFESQATGSPSKLSVPNRKVRNQPSNRVHDIEFAAEISTSLIAQVRNLQSLLAERDEELRDLQVDKSKLELETESLQQRLRVLDESEHRYKDENWNLETRLQELNVQQKETADREKKLALALTTSQVEKVAVQKELDDVASSHAKLVEEHASATKSHDIELGTVKRNLVVAEGERDAMQRKIDDLTSQNQELAKAVSAQRGRAFEREPLSGMSDDDFETATDNFTPEHSPPPSPVKGTPRHSVLETETMKASLHHAQRTLQSQRSQLHREKTEKLELRRIIQDLRDDLEKARSDAAGPHNSSRRSRKVESREFKKGSRLLGGSRSSKQDILDDPDWEDNQEAGSPAANLSHQASNIANPIDSSDHFETANEASESAFETPHERGTETEDFQTGHEDLSGSDGAETETEVRSGAFGSMRRPPSLPASLARPGNRDSFISTASTSDSEGDLPQFKTPTAIPSYQRSKARLSRGPLARASRQASEEPNMKSSPASFASSTVGTPRPGQSLFAELGDFDGSDDESMGMATPSRASFHATTPGSARRTASPAPAVPALPEVVMVDSGVMTDPVKISTDDQVEATGPFDRPMSILSVVAPLARLASSSPLGTRETDELSSRPISSISYSDASAQHDVDMDESLSQFPVPPMSQLQQPRPSLCMSSLHFEHVEPREELAPPPTPAALSLTPIAVEMVEPREERQAAMPKLTMTSILAENVHPLAEFEPSPPSLSLSGVHALAVEPVEEPEPPASKPVAQAPPTLTLSLLHTEDFAPIPETERRPSPSLGMSSIFVETIYPAMEPAPTPPKLVLSRLAVEDLEPLSAPAESPVLPCLDFSAIRSVETQPVAARSPWRDAFIIPRDRDDVSWRERGIPQTPPRNLGLVSDRGKNQASPPVIAEDETRQSPRETADSDTPESQRPFKEISSNTSVRPVRKQAVHTSDHGAQTSLTADAIDAMVKAGQRSGHANNASVSTTGTASSSETVRIHRSQESLDNSRRGKSKPTEELVGLRRPGSAASGRASFQGAPPLPPNHRQLIEAARSGSSGGPPPQGSMGPPLWPASAMKSRSRTPSFQRPMSPQSGRGTPTPRALRPGSAYGREETQSPTKNAARSRQSSISSFASELDTRFNMRPSEMGMDPTGFGPNTDPRMIRAITQTMIGEYLWKYTRKTGRDDLSEKRHRRYFWVHPYTRTLYWSDQDPSTAAGRSELRAKSVPIEAVRVVTDDNPMPPGLHRKSLVIISPGRTIKFTCTTGQRHETWFNALSYLLLRTNLEEASAEGTAEQFTPEDLEEFNPHFGRRPASSNRRAPPSLSSYNSRTTQNESPAGGASMNMPTLTPTGSKGQAAQRASTGTLSKLSGYWKPGSLKFSGTLSSLRSRSNAQGSGIYEASEVHDSAEDLREIIERQDRESDRLENVRACCDGK